MTEIKEGDKAHAQWGGGAVGGTVVEKKEDGPLEIETAGKKVHKVGEPGNAALHLKRSGNDVVKKESELKKDADGGKSPKSPKKADKEKKEDSKEKPDKSEKKQEKAEKSDKEEGKADKTDGKDEKGDSKGKAESKSEQKDQASNGDKRKGNGQQGAPAAKSQKTEDSKPRKAPRDVPSTDRKTRSSSSSSKK
ncbi:hypothetical protein PYCC9005_005794 [Savitreella phatthalungensis]